MAGEVSTQIGLPNTDGFIDEDGDREHTPITTSIAFPLFSQANVIPTLIN